jgi:stringent starvation protein B
MAEISTKPYLIRAIYEWCSDNGYTPYLAVSVDERTLVPHEFVKQGEIVLNVSPMATSRLSLGNDLISFQARFGGQARELSIPVENVSAIYARENGHGMAFDVPKPAAVPVPVLVPDARTEGGAQSPADERAPVLALALARSPAPDPADGADGVDGDSRQPTTEPDPAPNAGGGARGKARSGKPKLTRVK